ncbi:hypothetical protein NUW58_g9872 [Xylaria curta]|uniref:Uncharacterized protein n=1 Tax=Xylaria curta TaxID=42375 RepID=A0ACC1MT75_9PEZI|nr:hypothetical protein NUW58_g9872 [Xylaria curta]
MKNFIKQTALIRPPPSATGPEYSAVPTYEEHGDGYYQTGPAPETRQPNMAYVYGLTCFVSLGGFLFGWDQGVMAMIIADERWLKLMQPANDCKWLSLLSGGPLPPTRVYASARLPLIVPGVRSVGFVISIYNIGCVVGALTVGFFADVCGRERTISLASTVFIVGALIQAASYTIAQIVGKAHYGFPFAFILHHLVLAFSSSARCGTTRRVSLGT